MQNCRGGGKLNGMTSFAEILKAAEARLGAEAVAARLPRPKSAADLTAVADDRYLSMMCLRIFRAGLKHSLVDGKWPAFEEVFHGFDPRRIAAFNDEEMEALLKDARLIRHWGKLKAVRLNAAATLQVARDCGGIGAYLASWPADDIVGLWADIAKRFAQMGGNSGPMFLRMAGKDTFVVSPDVERALNHWGAVDGAVKSKGARQKAQDAFNRWAAESGRPLCQISMVLALSTD